MAAADPVEAKVLPVPLNGTEELLDLPICGAVVGVCLVVDVACQGAVIAGIAELGCAHGAAVVAIGFAHGAFVPAFEASSSSTAFFPELGNSSIVPLFFHGRSSPNQKC